jgi:GNS1/SUR4 family
MELNNLSSWLFYDLADPRIRDKTFMGSPLPIITWVLTYVALTRILKEFMKNRKPFVMKVPFIMFGLFNVAANVFFVIYSAPYWFGKYNWRCEPLDTSNSQDALRVNDYLQQNVLFCFALEHPGMTIFVSSL